MDLFEAHKRDLLRKRAPLADRMRPRTLDEFVGQEQVVGPGTLLRRAIEQDRLSSLILWGPPGSGKTTLARIIATVTKAEFVQVSAVSAGVADLRREVKEASDRLGMHGRRTILFIDEIHRLNAAVEEYLYPAMEDFRLDITIDTGPAARAMKIDLPPFTLVGATTRTGLLTSPLRDRFQIQERLEYY